MGGFRIVGVACLVFVSFAAPGCFLSQPGVDLARNEYIYRSSDYRAPRRTEGAVYVQRLQDRREIPDLSQGDTLKKPYSDADWERPVPVMVEELLLDEIDRSGIYNGLSSGSDGIPRSHDYVIEPILLAFYRYREAMLQGSKIGRRRAVAYAALRLRVLGPVEADGKRRTLLEETFRDAAQTPLSMARPEEGFVLAGVAMQKLLKRAMVKLYESNIRRVDATPITTEASAKADPTKNGPARNDPAKK